SGEIARFQRRFVSLEKSNDAENLIVERAFERGPADAVSEAAGFAPGFEQHAIDSFPSKRTAVVCEWPFQNTACLQVRRNEHRVPGSVHRLVHKRRRTRLARGQQLPFGTRDDKANGGFIETKHL